MIYEKFDQRPETFDIDRDHSLAKGLVFAGLGQLPGSTRYHDSSVFGNTGTLTGMDPATDWVWSSTLNRMACNFDGSNDEITSAFRLSKPMTLSAWIRGTDVTNIKTWLFDNASTFVFYTESGKIKAYVGSVLTGSKTISTNVWYHVCITYTGGALDQFTNGVADGSLTGVTSTPGTSFRIGYHSTAGRLWGGDIGDVCAWNRALTLPEIQAITDPSNVMLSGLLQPPRRKWWPVVAGGTPATSSRRRRLICSGY